MSVLQGGGEAQVPSFFNHWLNRLTIVDILEYFKIFQVEIVQITSYFRIFQVENRWMLRVVGICVFVVELLDLVLFWGRYCLLRMLAQVQWVD